jgi:lipopolysaccharide exporter
MSELASKSVSAAKWGLISSIGKFVLQLLVNVAVARLLGPEAYGLFALAAIGLLIATFVSEIGLGWSLIQRESLSAPILRFVFTWQCLSGLGGLLVMLLCGNLLAEFLQEPKLVPITQWLGLVCFFNALGATATNLLRRELRFRDLAKVQLTGYALAYGLLGIPLAFAGAGVWALVVAWIAQALFCSAIAYRVRPHPIKPLLRVENPREFMNLGAAVLLTNLCNWALTNADRLLIGRLAGAQSAGVYAVGYNLATVPNGLLISALQPAFLASGARLQDDIERMGRAYLGIQSFIWIVLAPLFFILAYAAPWLIALLYGDAWRSSVVVFAALACAMPAYLAWALTTPVLWSTGRKWLELGLQLPLFFAGAPMLYWAASHSIGTAAGIAATLFLARFLLMWVVASRALSCLKAGEWVVVAARTSLICVITLLPMAGMHEVVKRHELSLLVSAGAMLLAGSLPWTQVLWWFPRLLGAPAIDVLSRFIPKSTTWGSAWRARAFGQVLKA